MIAVNLKLYDIFRHDLHLPDEKAAGLVVALEESSQRHYATAIAGLATKEALKTTEGVLRKEIQQVETTLRGEIQHVETTLRSEIQQVATTLRGEIQHVETKIQHVETTLSSKIQHVETQIVDTKFELKQDIHELHLKLIDAGAQTNVKIEQVKSDLKSSIGIASLVQFIAIIGSVLAIINFMMRK
ncbi:hypothetical protein [Chitinophaga nivalis]|uniref:DUF1640 domain-containing protein n=1 Tax=Chitinophaga nivalis TaxID=2991709 RepID=A0ABT3ILM4_9BACT|nr:hypothetical protein [Chitinophaga nivalis]MCW3465446.1 hypothetical protein [Chitinophaga nivalis]MCW3484862.1 hypothetical protein [Chitinophaga nivalis]